MYWKHFPAQQQLIAIVDINLPARIRHNCSALCPNSAQCGPFLPVLIHTLKPYRWRKSHVTQDSTLSVCRRRKLQLDIAKIRCQPAPVCYGCVVCRCGSVVQRTALRRSLLSYPFIHNQRIDIALSWMSKGLRQCSHYVEAEFRPQSHRPFITRRYKIELHGLVSQLACNLL